MIHIGTVKIFLNDKQSKWPKIIRFVAALLASLVSRAAEFFQIIPFMSDEQLIE